MFGFRSAVPSRAHSSLVAAENALMQQSTRHPDGWGIGWFVDDEAYVVKSANAAHACERFQRTSSRLTSHTFVVHVRRATVGIVDNLNAHPFRFGRWLFAHNGTVFGIPDGVLAWLQARTSAGFEALLLGDTDSERLFFFLLSRLQEAGVDATGRRPAHAETVQQVVREALLELDAAATALGVLRPIVNVLLTDGRLLVAHRAGMPLFLSTQKRMCADFHLCPEPRKVCMMLVRPAHLPCNHLIVASEPIGERENLWEEVDDGSTVLLDERFLLSSVAPPPRWEAPILPEELRL